jgi:TolB protein
VTYRLLKWHLLTSVAIALLFLSPLAAAAQIKYFDISPSMRKMPLAVPAFKALTPAPGESELSIPMAEQLSAMLEFTGFFKILDRGAFLYNPQTSGITAQELNFPNWTTVGAEMLITGGIQLVGTELALEMRLYDTFKSTLIVGKRYRGTIENRRTMLKRFCADVMQALTGFPGMFDSRIAFVSNGTGHKEIYTCDFDGTDIRRVTQKGNITTFPAWSSDGKYMAYTSFVNGPAQIFVRDMATGSERNFNFPGVQIAPSWLPNRFELAATLSLEREQELFLLTGAGKIIRKLTDSRGIDVEAAWSPDGRKMVFVSNRAGSPQLYIQDINNGNANRLTFKGKYNTQPSWSPRGDLIAYSSMGDNEINIFVIDIEGKNPIQLTYNQGDNEAPSWSPDGSLIVFSSTREGSSRIFVMTAFGTDQRRLFSNLGQQTQPKWSPNLDQ